MNILSGKSIGRQLTPLGALLVAVAGLTLLFNILGAITASVVGGMMMVTSRRSVLSMVLGAFIPPAVVLVWSQVAQEALGGEKRLLAAAICFGAYGGTLLLTVLLMRLEGGRTRDDGEADKENAAPAPVCLATPEGAWPRMDSVGLPELQGRWRCDASLGNGAVVRREMEIRGDHFSLSVTDAQGGSRVLAQGSLRAQETTSVTMLMIYGLGAQRPAA